MALSGRPSVRGVRLRLAASVAGTAALYALFGVLLDVPLPWGRGQTAEGRRMPFIDFDELDRYALAPDHSSAQGEVVTGAQVQMGRVFFAAGTGAEEHAHPHEQMIYVLRGRLLAVSGGEVRELGPGQGAYHPAGVPHRVTALEDTELISVKAVLPADGQR